MKKIVRLLIICVMLGVGGFYFWETQFKRGFDLAEETILPNEIHSKNVLLQNLNTGEFLIEKNKNKEVNIASLTKLVTAYLLITESPDLTETVTINQEILDTLTAEGASLSGFLSGDELSINDLAYGIILPSGGDAALVAANYVSGSEEKFVAKMNTLAEEIGMTNTHFQNATGLDAKNHYSTLLDLNKFMHVALENPQFVELVTTTNYETSKTPYTPEGYALESTMLKDSEDLSLSHGEILGGKTGYTKKAGQCLVSLANVDGERYLLITTGANGNPFTELFSLADARYIYENMH